jgi:hypothetical protein
MLKCNCVTQYTPGLFAAGYLRACGESFGRFGETETLLTRAFELMQLVDRQSLHTHIMAIFLIEPVKVLVH